MKKIKVLLFIRSDCETNVGGDFYQLLQYFNALKSNGHKVEIAKGPKKELGEYEVVHIFNTYRVKESYLQLAYAKAAKVATILTPIWHSDELIKHLYWSKFRIPRIFYRPLKAFREYRYCRLNKIKIRVSESIRYTQMQKELISGVDYVIPNSSAELFFIEKELEINDRATCLMACGTGKTYVALWFIEKTKPKKIIVFVPSIALLKQIRGDWLSNSKIENLTSFAVCSDKTEPKMFDEIKLKVTSSWTCFNNCCNANNSLLDSLIFDEATPDWYKGISIFAKADRTSLLLSVLK